ncbi:HAMP domain-containing protein, partial [Klebsiella quasipneumoniae]|uniref:HAMP domain-containing protein n=1 Tax=Klebsiella quasipneumoniae TaxID=1463165 RepID=UPI0027310CDB
MGSCAAPSAKGDDKFITTDYLQQCRLSSVSVLAILSPLGRLVERAKNISNNPLSQSLYTGRTDEFGQIEFA